MEGNQRHRITDWNPQRPDVHGELMFKPAHDGLESVALKGTFVLLCVKMCWWRPLIHAEIRNLTLSEMLKKQRKHSAILCTFSDFIGWNCSLLQQLATCKVRVITVILWEVKSKQTLRSSEYVHTQLPLSPIYVFACAVVSAALQPCFMKKDLMTFKIIPPSKFVRLLALSCDFLPRNWPIIVVFVCSSQSRDLFSPSPTAVSEEQKSCTVDSDKADRWTCNEVHPLTPVECWLSIWISGCFGLSRRHGIEELTGYLLLS